MVNPTTVPPAEALAAYRRVVEQLAAGDDLDLSEVISTVFAAGKTTVDLSDDVSALAATMADDARPAVVEEFAGNMPKPAQG